jgi:glucose-6-phosphate isomerase
MAIKFDFTNAMDSAIGEKHGVNPQEIDALQSRAQDIHNTLERQRKSGSLGFYQLPYDDSLRRALQVLAAAVRKTCDNFVVLGIGGSALGAQCLCHALTHPYYNLFSRKMRKNSPRIFFLDNVDPEHVSGLLETLNLKRTLFNVVTKSGSTVETMATFFLFFNRLKRIVGPSRVAQHLIVTTDPHKGELRRIAQAHRLQTLPIPENVGGRFSVLSAVGLFPASVAGIDIHALLQGAQAMDRRCRSPRLWQNPAYLNAALHYIADTKKGKTMSVMMPYSNALAFVSDWYRQLSAESLGKRFSMDGQRVEVGQTPLKAIGATDQHSQIQLYNEGPNNKIITFIQVDGFRKHSRVPDLRRLSPSLRHLMGVELGELLNQELLATEFALTKNQRPNVKFILDAITPENLGGLLFLLEMQTAFAGGLYNVNAYDQPGVEEGKQATNALLGLDTPQAREKKAELEAFQKRKRYQCL